MSRHLKAYNAPKSWTILRKAHKWVLRPSPGAHPLVRALPIGLLLKQLGCGQTSREIKKVLNQKAVMIDGSVVKDIHHSTGFMDAISVKPSTSLRCTLDDKGRLKFIEAPAGEMNKKLCRIINKSVTKGGKIQLNLSDGRNILAEKGAYATGDTLLLEVPSQKILEHYPLAKGNTAFLVAGRHIGTIAPVEDIQGDKIWCGKGKEKIETLKQFAFIVGKDKPALKL